MHKSDGEFVALEIDPTLEAEVVEEDLWVKTGDKVRGFEGANDAIGTLVLKFASQDALVEALARHNKWLKVIVR